jgi:chloride channel protein, CIC family
MPPMEHQFVQEALPCLVLGMGCGLVGWLFARSLTLSEEFWKRRELPLWAKPVMVGVALGVVAVVFILCFGKVVRHCPPPPFFGNGYQVIEAMLDPASYRGDSATSLQALSLVWLVALMLAKIGGTSLIWVPGAAAAPSRRA